MSQSPLLFYAAGVFLGEAVTIFTLNDIKMKHIREKHYYVVATDDNGALYHVQASRFGQVKELKELPALTIKKNCSVDFLLHRKKFIKPLNTEAAVIMNKWDDDQIKKLMNIGFWNTYKEQSMAALFLKKLKKMLA